MHILHILGRVYPFLAMALGLSFVQFALFFRRRESRLWWAFAVFGVAAFGSMIAWFVLRGDLHSDEWVRTWFGELR